MIENKLQKYSHNNSTQALKCFTKNIERNNYIKTIDSKKYINQSLQKEQSTKQLQQLDFYNKYRSLQQEFIGLKDRFNKLEDQNKQLKIDIIQQKEENEKLRNSLDQHYESRTTLDYDLNKQRLIKNLKGIINELKIQKDDLQEELNEQLKHYNSQKIHLIEAENFDLINENYKLKSIIENNQNENSNLQIFQQLDNANQLSKQNQQLYEENGDLTIKNQQLLQIIQNQKIKIKNEQTYIKKTTNILQNYSFNEEKFQKNKVYQQKLDKIKLLQKQINQNDNDIQDQQNLLIEKTHIIDDLKTKLKKVTQLEDFIAIQSEQIQQLKEQNLQLTEDLNEYKVLLQIEQEKQQKTENMRKNILAKDLSQKMQIQVKTKFNKQIGIKNNVQKKLVQVSYKQIEQIVFQMKYRLIHKDIQFEEIDNFLFQNAQKQITIKQLMYNLSLPPFEVQSDKDQELVARYLCEQEQNEELFVNIMLKQDIPVVQSIFKCLVKRYKILSGKEKIQKFKLISQIFLENKQQINMYIYPLSFKKGLRKPYCYLNDLIECANLSQEQKDILITHIYNQTEGFEAFDMEQLWQLFEIIQDYENNKHIYFYKYLVSDLIGFEDTQIKYKKNDIAKNFLHMFQKKEQDQQKQNLSKYKEKFKLAVDKIGKQNEKKPERTKSQ